MWEKVSVLSGENRDVLKYVFEKQDAVAEAVLYKYPTYEERTVICCSTQSGCPVGCRFCGAGDYFVRSLSTEEIVAQPIRLLTDTGVHPSSIKRLQIMFMSMGEPLLNLKGLIPALHTLYNLFPRAALLISTIGPRVPYDELIEVSKQIPTIGLQFSVHESTDDKRDLLIPFEKKLNLSEIRLAGDRFFAETGRMPFFNYCVHDKNSSEEDAERLTSIFDARHWQATISVICERDETMSVAHERQLSLAKGFQSKLGARGFQTRVFDPAGQDDIGGGCGQLFQVQKWVKNHQEKVRASIGCGKPTVHPVRVELTTLV